MKKCNSLCAVFGIMAVMFFGTAFPAYATEDKSAICGSFDYADEKEIVGWGWECSSPNTAVPVRVTVTNTETSEIVSEFTPTAAVYRKELAESGVGNGNHGFVIQMDWENLNDGSYLIEGWVQEHKFENTLTYTKSSEETAEEESETADTPSMHSLGLFRTTGYCPCRQCSEGWGRHTSTGAIAQSNHTIAVDPRVIPYGSKVMINGTVYTAEDRGGGVKGNHIDIFFDSHAQTKQHGSRQQEVFLLS